MKTKYLGWLRRHDFALLFSHSARVNLTAQQLHEIETKQEVYSIPNKDDKWTELW